MLILAVNAGSSSLKISVYRRSNPVTLILSSSISNINSPLANLSWSNNPLSIQHHASAFAIFIDYLNHDHHIDCSNIKLICHRVVHGGNYTQPVIINQQSYHHIETLSDLAPLYLLFLSSHPSHLFPFSSHNGAALSVIKACIDDLPSATNIAYFDTSFHTSIPPHIANYPIDQSIARQRGLKKYGFHGLSCTSLTLFLSSI